MTGGVGIEKILSTLPPVPSEGFDGMPQDVQDVRCVLFQQPLLLRGSQVRPFSFYFPVMSPAGKEGGWGG